ncbi:MAG TPA: DNA polymerase III subunit beta [Firmicutes bacterium]|nr:DNA polymerase III subunit beta [Bacillota bacterium]
MKFTCPRETLLQGLQIVQRAVPAKSTLPILAGILLETAGDRLRLVATDLEFGIECFVPVQVAEGGSTVLEARFLTDIVRKFPELAIEFRWDEARGQAELRSGSARYTLHTMAAADFPTLPETSEEKTWEADQLTLRRMIRETSFAVAADETRPFLTGVLWEVNGEQVRMVATDTSRLAMAEVSAANEVQQVQVIIPTKCLSELSRLLEPAAGATVRVALSGNHIVFSLPEARFISRLIEGQFPSYQQVIPKAFKTKIELDREKFLAAAERASLLAKDGPSIVKLSYAGETVALSAFVPDVGQSEEQLPAIITGEDGDIAFNTRFLIEMLRAVEDERVVLELTGRHAPGVLHPQGEKDHRYTYVVMPVMLR